MLSFENQQWLNAFLDVHGRPPRVLHIGNIANNAYNNAKILNEAGLENDVICYDYYHIMGCPEWEDADFVGEWENDFIPNWAAIDLREFTRPTWFAQGQLKDCIDYLIARRIDPFSESASNLWRKLGIANGTILSPVSCWGAQRPRRLNILARVARRVNRTVFNIGFRLHAIHKFESLSQYQLIDNREKKLLKKDIVPYLHNRKKWKELLRSYDIVVGYSTDPFIPLLAGVPYFAFEHGTLRDIPFADDAQGRRTNLSYQKAQHVFVTNFDCSSNAERLAPSRNSIINHPFDEDHGNSVSGHLELKEELRQKLSSEFLFFFPTRHDWVSGTGYADKANDVFLNAFIELRKSGVSVGVVCCEWGANVAQSKELLNSQGMSSHVAWVKPLAIVGFERMAKACDVVVDQFKLGAFGGILFKAMAVGAPVLTYLDKSKVLEQYPEIPPVINCSTSEEITEKISAVLSDPHSLNDIGKNSRAWIKKYHSKSSTVNKQVDQFRIFLTNKI